MTAQMGYGLGMKLCRVLGLANVRRLVIDVQPDEPVIVYVQKLLETQEGDGLVAALEQFKPDVVVKDATVLSIDEKGHVLVTG